MVLLTFSSEEAATAGCSVLCAEASGLCGRQITLAVSEAGCTTGFRSFDTGLSSETLPGTCGYMLVQLEGSSLRNGPF